MQCWLTCRICKAAAALPSSSDDADDDAVRRRRVAVREALAGAVVCGLCVSHQHASLLFLLVLVPAVLHALAALHQHRSLLLVVLQLSCCFWLGVLVPYGCLVWWARVGGPTLGSWGDVTSARGLLRHVLRQEYGTFKVGEKGGRGGQAGWGAASREEG